MHSMTLLPLLLVACAAKSGGATGSVSRASVLSESASTDGLTLQEIDLNGDQKADVFNYQRPRVETTPLLVRKEVDLNWDGRIDVRSWFDDLGNLEREEMDGDFDGRVDWVDHYKGGVRVMSEVDTDFNGNFDLFRYYEGGKVRRKERDSNADGRIDFWQYFDDAGKVVKIGRDVDGDGVMDVRDD
jgi:hypothetical protein